MCGSLQPPTRMALVLNNPGMLITIKKENKPIITFHVTKQIDKHGLNLIN